PGGYHGYALLGVGLWARLHRRHKQATNGDPRGGQYHTVTLTGQPNLAGFASEIGFLTERKNLALRAQIGLKENSNVDVIPIRGGDFARLPVGAALSNRPVHPPAGVRLAGG